jgi:hypothetical protein
MNKCFRFFLAFVIAAYAIITFNSGCAQIGAVTGGPRDSLAPVLIKATPPNNATNFTGNRISLNFDEYVDVQDLQNNLVVSPVPKNNPIILNNLKNVTIKFRDTLLPNTTYSINFGNAIRDVNEGNILKNFTYAFSTGKILDSLTFHGHVFLAETGKTDSTIIVMLYKNADDSAVQKIKPNYIAKVNGDGSFLFKNLPAEKFKVYALKDGDGGKTYNSKTELFAFTDAEISVSQSTDSLNLYASALEKEAPRPQVSGTNKKPVVEKSLRFSTNLEQGTQSLLDSLQLIFNNPIKEFDAQKIALTDTNFAPFTNAKPLLDSTAKKLSINIPWQPEQYYVLVLQQDALLDSFDNKLAKNDTLRFKAKSTEAYGNVVLRFSNLDLTKHPVIQFVTSNEVKFSYPITANTWSNKLFVPGEYEIRILYDTNQNGIWDPGNYNLKLQPEKVIPLPQKIAIKANWDNERDINL